MTIKLMVFLKVEIGTSRICIKKLQKIPEIKQISYITGEYDIMFTLETNRTKQLYQKFVNDIDSIPEIKESSSHLIVQEWNQSDGD
ncbi:MAG: Lrp/AsnC ligand binding domain-containing protein [Promethearchaeota archaeon]